MVFFCLFVWLVVYLYLPKGLNFSLTSNISLRRKLKTQAESDFIHILRYSDNILVDDPGEKKCSVGDVRCFFTLVFNFYIFFRAETPTKRAKTPEMRFSCKTVNFFNTVINNISTIYSVSGHLNQTSSKSLKNTIGQKKTPQAKKNPFGLKFQPEQLRAEKAACGRPRYARLCTIMHVWMFRTLETTKITNVNRRQASLGADFFFRGPQLKTHWSVTIEPFFSHFRIFIGGRSVPSSHDQVQVCSSPMAPDQPGPTWYRRKPWEFKPLKLGKKIHVIEPSNYGLMSTYSRNRASKCIVNLWASEASMDDVKMDFVPLSVALRWGQVANLHW